MPPCISAPCTKQQPGEGGGMGSAVYSSLACRYMYFVQPAGASLARRPRWSCLLVGQNRNSNTCCHVVSVLSNTRMTCPRPPRMGFVPVDGTGFWKAALEPQILFLLLPHRHLVVDLAIMVFKNVLLVYVLQMLITRHFLGVFHLAGHTFSFNSSTESPLDKHKY